MSRKDKNINLTVLRKVEVTQVDRQLQQQQQGTKLVLNDLWARQPCVIVFLRRFHCPYAKLAAAEISKLAPELLERNVRLLGIGSGFSGAQEFAKREYLAGDLFVDAAAKSYAACGFKVEGFANVPGMMYSAKARRETSKAKQLGYGGHFKLGGNSFQDGGVLVVDREGGEVVYLWRQQEAMDRCDNANILQALDAAASGGRKKGSG